MGNPHNVVFRSSYEYRAFQWCDLTENIIEWGSEEFFIYYISPKDNRRHRYYPDLFIKIKNSEGNVTKYVCEIKPARQTIPPKQKSRVTKNFINESIRYSVNNAKWEAAKEFCERNEFEFMLLTEKELGIK